MGNDRNKLHAGVASLLSRPESGAMGNVELAHKGGRPPRERPSSWNSKRDYRTSLVMDRDQYNEIRALANSTGLTLKQLMYLLLEEGLRRHQSGDLKINGLRG